MTHRARWFTLAGLALSIAGSMAACSGDGGGGTVADAGRDPGPDGHPQPDARAPGDAGERTVAELCARICANVEICFSLPPDPGCADRCVGYAADCSDEERQVLDECAWETWEKWGCFGSNCEEEAGCLGEWEVCGNGQCEAGETCDTCFEDCDPCLCGDGECVPGESCESCARDCECVCGDQSCGPGECDDCAVDCPAGCFCPHDECAPGERLDPECGECAARVCARNRSCCSTEWGPACVRAAEVECGIDCPPVCGDRICEEGESNESCAEDCRPVCGDGFCNPDAESCDFCSEDCGACVCGDGTCNVGECGACEADCPGCTCPHDVCTRGEPLDPHCSQCEARVCDAFLGSHCCQTGWDVFCRLIAESVCDVDCPAECGDQVCDTDETCESCVEDCC